MGERSHFHVTALEVTAAGERDGEACGIAAPAAVKEQELQLPVEAGKLRGQDELSGVLRQIGDHEAGRLEGARGIAVDLEGETRKAIAEPLVDPGNRHRPFAEQFLRRAVDVRHDLGVEPAGELHEERLAVRLPEVPGGGLGGEQGARRRDGVSRQPGSPPATTLVVPLGRAPIATSLPARTLCRHAQRAVPPQNEEDVDLLGQGPAGDLAAVVGTTGLGSRASAKPLSRTRRISGRARRARRWPARGFQIKTARRMAGFYGGVAWGPRLRRRQRAGRSRPRAAYSGSNSVPLPGEYGVAGGG